MTPWYDINVESFRNDFFKSHNLCFSHIFLFGITTGKGIGRIYKYDHRNLPYPSKNTNFIIPQRSDTYIQVQHNSASDAYVGAHDVVWSGLDQSTNHHGNADVKDNDDS